MNTIETGNLLRDMWISLNIIFLTLRYRMEKTNVVVNVLSRKTLHMAVMQVKEQELIVEFINLIWIQDLEKIKCS